MNKAVHALVYVILAVAAVALYFEINLYDKKELLKDSNKQLRECIVTLSKTIEKADAAKPGTPPEARKDVSPIEAKALDTPETENLLEDYPAQLEEANLETLNWNSAQSAQLRNLYAVDGEGNKCPDPANPGDFMKSGKGTAQELIDVIIERSKAQQAKLNSTRAELAQSRTRLEGLVNEYNKIKPEARQDKVTIEEQKANIADLEQKKAAVEEQLKKTKAQVEELDAEVKSLKDEVNNAKDETENVKEDLAKSQKLVDQLKKLLQNQPARTAPTAPGAAVGALTAGNKGKIVEVNNKLMFAVIEFDDAAMAELLGPERNAALPLLEMGLRRTGFKGAAGEYIGRIRLRQAVQGKNFVIADVMGDWLQAPIEKGDIVFAE